MDKAGKKRVVAKITRARRTRNVDMISDLPDALLCQVLLNLPTKDVVKTRLLSRRWKHLWKHVPGLDLDGEDFKWYCKFVRFVDIFMGFNNGSCLDSFKLTYPGDGNCVPDIELIRRWIDTLVKLNVKHLDFLDYSWGSSKFHIPPSIYTCKSLVYLKLSRVNMSSTVKIVSLPSLKTIDLNVVNFVDDSDLEKLISGSPVLESLFIRTSGCDDIDVLRVCSQSLLRFTHVALKKRVEKSLVVVDAPKLEYMKLKNHRKASFIIKNPGPLVSVDIDIVFNLYFTLYFNPNDLPKRDMIRDFLLGIYRVKTMTISSTTLEVLYNYSRCEPLPLFCNLSFLRVIFDGNMWEMLPNFLESCPNLKSLVLGSTKTLMTAGISILPEPQCSLPSLEYVEINKPLEGDATDMELVGYLLENSPILKKLTLCLADSRKVKKSVILKKLDTIPRLSSSCQVVIL